VTSIRSARVLIGTAVALAGVATAVGPETAGAALPPGAYANPGSRDCGKVIVGGFHRVFVRAAHIRCATARTVSANWYRATRCWDFRAPAPARRTCRLGAWRCEARPGPGDVSNIEIQSLFARCRRAAQTITIQTFPEQD
jgi:hypothetical protein